jgi:hypothetical protein
MAERKVGGRTSARRLRDYDARRRELTAAFNLPDGLRTWVTVRMDSDPETADTANVCAEAGQTRTVKTLELPAGLRRALEAFLAENREELEHQLKLDLATNLLASMSGAFAAGPEDAE